MKSNYLCVILAILFVVSKITAMAQSISLDVLIEYQNNQSPIFISNSLSTSGEWITDAENFENKKVDYFWYKAIDGEEFEPHTKDQISLKTGGGFKRIVTYITLTKSNFDAIKSEIQSTMVLSRMIIDDPKAKMYLFSNDSINIELIEPFELLKYDLIRYVVLVYNKQDYEKGYRLK